MSTTFKHWITKYKIEPTGVLHAGAHLVQERDLYRELGMEPVLWIEAHPEIAKKAENLLLAYPNQRILNAALWSFSDHEVILREAGNEGSSSSLLQLGLITGSHPQVICTSEIKVLTKTLEEIIFLERELIKEISFLCVDTQGAEAEVIKGLGAEISKFDYILAEVSIRRLYKDSVLFRELTEQLGRQDFLLIASNINQNTGWGDALYIRDSEASRLGIKESDYEHILISEGRGWATKIRYFLLRMGLPNKLVSKISRRN